MWCLWFFWTGPRRGLCPRIRRHPIDSLGAEDDGEEIVHSPSLCGNLCTKDDACPIGKKCCPTSCGYACYDPVILADTVWIYYFRLKQQQHFSFPCQSMFFFSSFAVCSDSSVAGHYHIRGQKWGAWSLTSYSDGYRVNIFF
jgi:hypothetical protein